MIQNMQTDQKNQKTNTILAARWTLETYIRVKGTMRTNRVTRKLVSMNVRLR
jgi:hypothetical protein